jgi:hypothetical protein
MTTPNPLRVLIREKLADGRLPVNSIPRVWGGPGNDEMCDACEKIVTKDEFVIEGIGVEGSRSPVQLHVACFRFWEEERRAIIAAGVPPRVPRFPSATRRGR